MIYEEPRGILANIIKNKTGMSKWLKNYIEKERLLQQVIDNDPASKTLYTYEIDIDTLVCEANQQEEYDYDEEMTGYAEYEESCDGRRVYAESLRSSDEARELVYNYLEKFKEAYDEISHIMREESVADCDCREQGQICDCYQLSER